MWVVLAACTWVDRAAWEAKLASVDDDGDGASASVDCNDADADAAPGLVETPYDGIDNDCLDGDLVDVDADGWPGVDFDAYGAEHPHAVWPSSVREGPVDCADDPAVWAEAASIHPEAPEDAAYDGIDANCLGDEDFDLDTDGWLPDSVVLNGVPVDVPTARAAYAESWQLNLPELPGGDCLDVDQAVHPGALDDPPYDGVDSDCDGTNEFDADGDGTMAGDGSETDPLRQAFDSWVARFLGGVAPDAPFGDCLDVDDPARPADPASVYPGAVDVPYDAVDANCDGANDYDVDGDGVMPTEPALDAPNDFATYVERWGYIYPEHTPVPQLGDCNDDDATVHPGARESLVDGVDLDCDGEDLGATVVWDANDWTGPRPPEVVDLDDAWAVATTADAIVIGANVVADIGVAIHLPADFLPTSAPLGTPLLWQGVSNPQPLGPALDLVGLDGTTWYAATSFTWDDSTFLVGQPVTFDGDSTLGPLDVASDDGIAFVNSIDVAIDDDGEPWTLACGGGVMAAQAPLGSLSPKPVVGSTCFWAEPPADGVGVAIACNPEPCTAYAIDPEIGAAQIIDPRWTGFGPYLAGDQNGELTAAVGLDGSVHLQSGFQALLDPFPGWVVRGLDVAADGPRIAAALLVDTIDGPAAVLLTGPAGGPFEGAMLDLSEHTPTGVGVAANAGQVVVAVAALTPEGEGRIGWVPFTW